MEGPPSTGEHDTDSKESGKKKKKSAEALGVFAVEPERAVEKEIKETKSESLWQRLIGKEAEVPKVEAVSEAEAPLEELSPAETQLVEHELVAAESVVTPEQPTATDPVEVLTEQAVEVFRTKIVEGQDSDQALAETLDELDIETAEEAEAELPEAPQEFEDIEIQIERPSAAEIDDEAEEATPPVPAGAGGSSTPPPPAARSGGNPPPSRPPAGPGGTGFGVTGGLPFNPNANASPRTRVEYIDTSNPVADMLIGGIIGYLIGRRRGRIKTEKKLLPIQKKLEKQVKNVREQLQFKEARLRKVVAEKARQDRTLVAERLAAAKSRPERTPEARQLPASKAPPERIGHVIVEAEQLEPRQSAKVNKSEFEQRAEVYVQPMVDRHIETMNRTELLTLSEKIIVDGSSLRQIYETHLVGERGLRRLVHEHLKGGDLKKALRREIVEREIDFERDPMLRDQATASDYTTSSPAKLQTMLEKASASLGHSSEEVAFLKARAAYEAEEQNRQQTRRRLMDTSLVSVILILGLIIVILLLSRG